MDALVESDMPILVPESGHISVAGDITEWPWPRLFTTNFYNILVTKQPSNHLYAWEITLEGGGEWTGYVVADLGDANDISWIDVISFGPFYVICTSGSAIRNWLRDTTLDNSSVNREELGTQLVVEMTSPVFASGCNYNGQLVAGNVGGWQDLGTNGIVWSAIGSLEFNPEIDVTAGWRSLINAHSSGAPCIVHRVMRMEESVILYTDHGNLVMGSAEESGTATYGLALLKGLGIRSGHHVAGDEHVHGFIDVNNEFWRMENVAYSPQGSGGGKVEKLGYKGYIEEMLVDSPQLIVSYIPLRRTFFVSNGVITLVINDYGAGIVHQAISSAVIGWDGVLYGTFRDFGDREARVTLDGEDFGTRGLKHVGDTVIGARRSNGTLLHCSDQWLKDTFGEYRQTKWVPVNPRGEAYVGVSGSEHRLQVRFSSYVGSELYSLKVGVKFEDGRFRRGAQPQSAASVGT